MADRYGRLLVKYEWAKNHIDNLEVAVEDFRGSHPHTISHTQNVDRDEVTFFVSKVADIPDSLALMLGDAIHNLRGTLDHLASALVSAAGGTPDKYTSFPIFDTYDAYKNLSRDRLKGVGKYCFDVIDNIQPYKGAWGSWAWQLHQLDVVNKHRLLLTVTTMAIGRTMTMSEKARFETGHRAIDPKTSAAYKYALANFSPDLAPVVVGYKLGKFPASDLGDNMGFSFDLAVNEPNIVALTPTFMLLRFFRDEVLRVINNLARFL